MSRYITKLGIAFALLFVLMGTTRAQETANSDRDIIRPITKSGSAAFLFTVQGLGTFGIGAPSVNGLMGGVGAKWFVVDNIAIRTLLGVSSTQDVDTYANDATLTTTSFGIGVGAEYHFRPFYSTSPYAGAQVGFTSVSEDVDVNKAGDIESDKTTAFSVEGIAGFDWFFTRGLAAGAEMGLGFLSHGGTTSSGASKTSTSNIALATDGNVHFVVYF